MTRKIALLMTVLALVASACGTAQEMAQVEELAAGAPTVAETAPAPDSADGEGIEVHGHWTIEVRNPDGSLDERHEFENALTPEGNDYLVGLLAGTDTFTGGWAVSACQPSPVGASCLGMVALPPYVATGPDGLILRLTGSETPAFDFTFESVETATGDVALGTSLSFTAKTLDTPIDILAGQEVEITVEISFS